MNPIAEFYTSHKKPIIWFIIIGFVIYAAIAVKEITLLLITSYAIAVLLEPLLIHAQKRGFSRTTAILSIGSLISIVLIIALIIIIPAVLQQMGQLLNSLPLYVETTVNRISTLLETWLGIALPETVNTLAINVKDMLTNLESEQINKIAAAAGATLVKGYSITLTILNLFLLPFFIFYISRDLPKFHNFIVRQLPQPFVEKWRPVAQAMLNKVYAFFKGQLTVSLIMAVLYSIGLTLIGLPMSVAIGTLAGLLNIVPYLGFAIGIILATTTSIVAVGTFIDFLLVCAVFAFVQIVEGSFLTPKIVGDSVGIHPLLIMVTLIVFGTLFGLLGMIIAIPAAAALGVLARSMLADEDDLYFPKD